MSAACEGHKPNIEDSIKHTACSKLSPFIVYLGPNETSYSLHEHVISKTNKTIQP